MTKKRNRNTTAIVVEIYRKSKQGKKQLNCTINKGKDNLAKVKPQFSHSLSLYLTPYH